MRPETIASIEGQKTNVPYVWEVGYHNPYPEKVRNVVAQYQRARELCLAGNYEALLTVEDDMILPPNTVSKLMGTDAAVVYGVYMLRHGVPTLSAWRYENDHDLGMSLSLYPHEVKAHIKKGWARVSGVGWGCTLIRREVLERQEIHSMGGGDAGDLTFGTECLRNGFLQIARFDVPCGHICPNGEVLEIHNMNGIVGRVYSLQDFNANVNNVSVPMKKGSYYTIPVDVARELARGGYVNITNFNVDEEIEREQPDIATREMAVSPKATKRATRKVS